MLNIWILLSIFLAVALIACSMGFKKFVWFLSIGYGFAVAALGISYFVWDLIAKQQFDIILTIQCALFVIYGLRLSLFLLIREIKNAQYRKVLAEASGEGEKKIPFFVLFVMWLLVGVLYVAQTSEVFYRAYNGATDIIMPIIGLCISALGIVLEALADKQKSAQKKINPHMVATKGLYRMVRCPNYLGEITFWTGMFVGSVTSLVGVDQWIIVVLGWICIVYIMINGAQRLDRRQEKNYGKDEEYRKYADHTPLVFPLLPIYHIGAYKVEDIEAKKAKKANKKEKK